MPLPTHLCSISPRPPSDPGPLPWLSRLFLVGLALLLLAPLAAQAQHVIRANDTLYGRLGVGTSVSETDVATYAVEFYSLQGEIGYQWTRSLGFAAGLTYADYPKANFRNTTMSTVQGLMRWTIFPNKTGTPYFNVGGHATLGGDNPAGGLLFGLGYDHVLTHRLSAFAEATAYGTFPDAAIDSRDDGRATFDGLGFWGLGVRATLKAAPTKPTLQPIEAPERIYRGESALFSARVNDDATPPIRYTWAFGDGSTGSSMVSENVYPLEGDYWVTVTAENAAGIDTQTLRVAVHEPTAPASIVALSADTLTVETHQLVRFASTVEGTAPLGASWDFGDGTAPVVERGSHRYAGDRYIGVVAHDLSQGYVYETPGLYTVTLEAENAFGASQKTVLVEVTEGSGPLLARRPCTGSPPADTVYFGFDRDVLTTEAKRTLRRTLSHLQRCPETLVRMGGYADWVGSHAYNDALSARRADAVARFYVDNGLDPDRLLVRSFGELPPPCPDGFGPPGCQTHRRVEAVIMVGDAPHALPQLADRSSRPSSSDVSTRSTPVRTVSQPASAPQVENVGGWTLVVASMSTAARAEAMAARFEKRLDGTDYRVRTRYVPESNRHRVTLQTFATQREAVQAKDDLGARLPEDAWVLSVPASDHPLTRR